MSDAHDEDIGVFVERLRNLAEDPRYSDEFIGILVRSRWPQRYVDLCLPPRVSERSEERAT